MVSFFDDAKAIGYKYFKLKNNKQILPTLIHFSSSNDFQTETIKITLPSWASGLGIGEDNYLLAYKHCLLAHNKDWRQVDWWRVAYEMATSHKERLIENEHGPSHSYSHHLPMCVKRITTNAWVNRIFIFLRKWYAHELKQNEDEIFEQIPKARIYLSHDVDYVKKTLPLRIKKTVFDLYNIIKKNREYKVQGLRKELLKVFRFIFNNSDYYQFNNYMELEDKYDVRSNWNFYGGKDKRFRTIKEWLFDPSYRVLDKKMKAIMKRLLEKGHSIGLHQGFKNWHDSAYMLKEKNNIEKALSRVISSCRQHWLRFSFKDTWQAQEKAGFKLDMTLGFNDSPGFRNGSALRIPAWISSANRFSKTLESVPMVLMDSHLFDYAQHSMQDRKRIIDDILDEISFVGGEASIIWHQRVLHPDYNWGCEYEYLLQGIKKRGVFCASDNG